MLWQDDFVLDLGFGSDDCLADAAFYVEPLRALCGIKNVTFGWNIGPRDFTHYFENGNDAVREGEALTVRPEYADDEEIQDEDLREDVVQYAETFFKFHSKFEDDVGAN